MVSFALVNAANLEQSFYAELHPITDVWVPEALAVSGFSREQTLKFEAPASVMNRLDSWLQSITPTQRAIVWSDNPGFDWQFLNYYCHAFLGRNPMGHSARRIGDFNAGLQRNARDTSSWRKWRGEAHTHNALNDARGNARALARLFQNLAASKKPA